MPMATANTASQTGSTQRLVVAAINPAQTSVQRMVSAVFVCVSLFFYPISHLFFSLSLCASAHHLLPMAAPKRWCFQVWRGKILIAVYHLYIYYQQAFTHPSLSFTIDVCTFATAVASGNQHVRCAGNWDIDGAVGGVWNQCRGWSEGSWYVRCHCLDFFQSQQILISTPLPFSNIDPSVYCRRPAIICLEGIMSPLRMQGDKFYCRLLVFDCFILLI